jgi:predicted nucleotidyltransferase
MEYWPRYSPVPTAAAQSGDLSWTVTEEKVWTALQRLIAAADPVKIVAFGSRAKGAAREDSDLDLAVILGPDSPKPTISLWGVLSGLRMSVDLIVADEARHERFRRSINSVHHDIAEEGVVLYRKGENGSPDRDAVARLCRPSRRGIDELRQIWQQALAEAGPGLQVEKVIDRLELRYQALAHSFAENE